MFLIKYYAHLFFIQSIAYIALSVLCAHILITINSIHYNISFSCTYIFITINTIHYNAIEDDRGH